MVEIAAGFGQAWLLYANEAEDRCDTHDVARPPGSTRLPAYPSHPGAVARSCRLYRNGLAGFYSYRGLA